MTATVSPHVVQRPQPRLHHHTQHKDCDHDTHMAQQWHPQHPHNATAATATPMWHGDCDHDTTLLRFYPHFSTFLTHVTSRAFSLPRHLPNMCLQVTGLILAYIALTCIILFVHVLVWFLTAVPRLLITFL